MNDEFHRESDRGDRHWKQRVTGKCHRHHGRSARNGAPDRVLGTRPHPWQSVGHTRRHWNAVALAKGSPLDWCELPCRDREPYGHEDARRSIVGRGQDCGWGDDDDTENDPHEYGAEKRLCNRALPNAADAPARDAPYPRNKGWQHHGADHEEPRDCSGRQLAGLRCRDGCRQPHPGHVVHSNHSCVRPAGHRRARSQECRPRSEGDDRDPPFRMPGREPCDLRARPPRSVERGQESPSRDSSQWNTMFTVPMSTDGTGVFGGGSS